jgi:Zn-dependent metalloprotease
MRKVLGLATITTAVAMAAATFGVLMPAQASGSGADRFTRPAPAQRVVQLRQQAIRSLDAHPALARAAQGQTLRARQALVDPSGASHVRVDRFFHGLRVVGGDLVVHNGPGGALSGVSQTLASPLTLRVTPTITRTRALARALSVAPAQSRRAGRSVLVVDALGSTPRLAWAAPTVGKYADGTPSRLTTYVDARTGKVLQKVEGVMTDSGTGNTLYSGTVPLDVTKSGSTYLLKNSGTLRGGTYTTDMKNKSDGLGCQLFGFGCSAGTQITSATTTFGTGSNSNRASAGADAQYGSNETWDYYQATFGRNGIFNTGKGSYNRVHYGNGYVNAFWDGTKMTYGDGDGTSYGPLVSLDVAGHEMSHGVTENSAGLTYSGESGGLNEATSDIFGTMVEFYANNANDPGDYLIGEEFDLKNHLGFRRMDDPASDGSSLNCWSSSAGNVDVHYSSGIGNHFFYLLAMGSGAKTLNGVSYNSPTCNGSTVTGIGNTAAAAIWYRALTVYMTSSTNYAGARTATLDAARDLYGAGSANYNAVGAAWSAVNVS